ncbi:MAG: hypothetical protein AAF927_13180 [Bacteroidota bacterium]
MDWRQAKFRPNWQKRLLVASCLLIVLITVINLLVSSHAWFSDNFSGIVEQVQQTLDLAPGNWLVS